MPSLKRLDTRVVHLGGAPAEAQLTALKNEYLDDLESRGLEIVSLKDQPDIVMEVESYLFEDSARVSFTTYVRRARKQRLIEEGINEASKQE